ncbi:MAG: aminodeoxychorismate synthase component I [Oleiphilaceae bacterium]|nr:aminodeoxychorismate synthase component I [Oleiphilaceae bacterium]
MAQQRITEILWPDLVRRFSATQGTVLFDIPDHRGEPARYQLLSAWPVKRWQVPDGQPVAAVIREINGYIAGHRETQGDWLPLRLGFMAYGDGEQELGPARSRHCAIPALVVQEHDWVLVLDRSDQSITLHWSPDCPADRLAQVRQCLDGPESSPEAFRLTAPFAADTRRSDYLRALQRVDHYIHAGDVYQVNYAQRFQARYRGHPLLAFLALYQASPNPCSAYMDLGGQQILSLSPERFIRVQEDRVETRPIKGTRRRGRDGAEDQAMIRELTESPKDRAENLMIVDLLRNDLGRCCETGSITAEPLFAVESYTNVHHLVSTVRGRLKKEFTPLDMLLSAFPGGSITGAPKRRAMEIIRELEPAPRGAYCGSFFHWTPANGFDSTIAIRTLECLDGVIRCWGGGGIVADSEPAEEYQESLTKIRLFMDVLEKL